jgi:tetratricopeptide (TPR) repeat protein
MDRPTAPITKTSKRASGAALAIGTTMAALVVVSSGASAQTLGRVDFPNSGSAAAQQPFITGVLYLHSFEYEEAARAFEAAERLDPDFALAYWGEAMTWTHPVWNQQDTARGRAALAKLAPTAEARAAKAATARERGFLQAVEILYGPGPKPARDTLYSRAMARLAAEYPGDLEARSFYALSLLGLSQGVRNVPTYMRAGAIAEEVLRENPDHPGAAHYVIHAFDDPVHAPLGLHAARMYSGIAPDAPHAQHMTTHIFLALGMWDEVISQNAIAVSRDEAAPTPGHYSAWWLYGLLEAGRLDEARRLLDTVHAHMPARASAAAHLFSMRAHYLVNSQRWNDEVRGWQIPATAGPVPRAMDAFALAYAALMRGDRGTASRGLDAMVKLAPPPKENDDYGGTAVIPGILATELRAAIAAAEGRREQAIRLLHAVGKIEDGLPAEFGPPDIVKPSHELLGEMLLGAGRPAEAEHEFQRALQLAPKRSLSLVGLVRAATAAGHDTVAADACDALRASWHAADPGVAAAAKLGCLVSIPLETR